MSVYLKNEVQRVFFFCVLLVFFIGMNERVLGIQESGTKSDDVESLRKKAIENGLKFLRNKGQAADGSFTSRAGAGITALAVTAGLRNGLAVDDPMIKKGLKALEKFVKPDGGIYGGGRLKNYETCVAMVAFSLANKDGKYKKTLADAKRYITSLQIASGRKKSDPWYGGVGYSGSGRPDLSNTAHFIEALKSAGAEANDPAIQRALVFVGRCQNLPGHGNDTKFADLIKDGGFYYVVPTESVDPSRDSKRFSANGGLRSYGSMTYAGFKSMVFAGLTEKDPRVKAAKDWIKKTYAVDKNPGMGQAGLFYYYHTFSTALNASGFSNLADEQGKVHNWKSDLVKELSKRQQDDGSWKNANAQWFENNPNLATSFSLIALSYCQPKKGKEKK